MRYLAIVLSSVFLASVAVFGVSAVGSQQAQAAGTAVKTCTGGTMTLKTNEYRMLRLHNKKRADRGLPRFCVHPALQKAARAHSKDMIERDYFSHGTKGRNESACERIRRFGYRWRYCAENIAWGSGSKGEPGPIFRSWMKSSGHRTNILNRRYREIGIGAYKGNYKGIKGVTMWTANFGKR